jgi:hypothetical protein
MKKIPQPRNNRTYMMMPIVNLTFPDGTWLEGEEFAYPNGGFTRRAYATCENGEKRLVMCSIPDTFFSIPARDGKVKRFITIENGLLFFHEQRIANDP